MRVCTSVNNQCLNYFNQLLLTYLYSTGSLRREIDTGHFLPARVQAMAQCLSVSVSVTSRCSIETDERTVLQLITTAHAIRGVWHNPPPCCQIEGLLQLFALGNAAVKAAWRLQSTGQALSSTGFAPDPAGERTVLHKPPCQFTLPKNPTPLSALWTSIFGLASWASDSKIR